MSESPFSSQQSAGVGVDTWWTYAQKFLISAGSTLFVILLIALGVYGWRSYESSAKDTRDRQFYSDLNSILTQIQDAREGPSPDFATIRQTAEGVRSAIVKALRPDASSDFPARQALFWAARDELPRMMQENLAAVSEAEVRFARHMIQTATLLKLPPPSLRTQTPETVAALAEIERLGGIVTREPSRPIQPVTAVAMKGDQFRDQHLDQLPNIASLEIESSEVTDAGLRKLRRIRSLTACRLRCVQVTDKGIANLAALPALSEVHLYDCFGITDHGLLELKRVQRLVLFGSHITDQTLAVLKGFPNLQQLGLRSDSLTDDGFGAIASLPHLTSLVLSHCHNLTDAALSEIAAIQNLETLGILGADITDAGLESLGKLPRLRELVILPCETRMPEGLKITDAGLTGMKNLRDLHTISIQACPAITDASIKLLQTLGSLKSLKLNETGMTEEGHQQLVASLPNTQIDFSLAPPDDNLTADRGNDVSPDQPSASCQRWPIPDARGRVDWACTIEELEIEYRIGREATDAKYNGKLMEISGPGSSSGNNLEGDPTVRLSGSDGRFEINCVLRSAKDLMNVVDGETCRLRGVYCISIVPTFVHCTVVSTENPITNTVETSADTGGSDRRPPDETLTAEQLESEITADARETSRKYAGKVMQITGRLSRISYVVSGAMVYRLGDPFSTQYFVRTGNPWYCARPGQTITLVGKWNSGYPCLVNCEVISVTGRPNPTLTAVSLGEKLESNRARFRKQFYLQQIIVTGEVIQKSPLEANADRFAITLRSTQATSVVCEMEADEFRSAESLQIGDSVTITGWNTKETPTDSVILVQCLFWRGK